MKNSSRRVGLKMELSEGRGSMKMDNQQLLVKPVDRRRRANRLATSGQTASSRISNDCQDTEIGDQRRKLALSPIFAPLLVAVPNLSGRIAATVAGASRALRPLSRTEALPRTDHNGRPALLRLARQALPFDPLSQRAAPANSRARAAATATASGRRARPERRRSSSRTPPARSPAPTAAKASARGARPASTANGGAGPGRGAPAPGARG